MDDVGLLPGIVTFLVLAGGGCLLLGFSRLHSQTLSLQTKLFLYSFALRFLASLLIYQFGLVNILKDEDGSGWVVGVAYKAHWHEQGITLLDLPQLFLQAYEGRQNHGYYYLIGCFYFLTNTESRLPAAALNCFFGAMMVVLVYRIARCLLPERAAQWVGWWTCLFPSLIVWSAQTIKEPIVLFLETLALYCCVRLRQSPFNAKYLSLGIASIGLLSAFRFYATYVAIATFVLGLLPAGRDGRQPLRLLAVAVFLILVAMFSGMLQRESAEKYLDLQYIEQFRRFAAVGQGSAVYVEADLNTSLGLGTALLVGGFHLLLAPLPWQWSGSLRLMLVIPEVVVWWWLLWTYILPGLKYVVRRRLSDFAPLLLFVLLMGSLYSMMFSNVGLVYRQRAQLLPWLFVIAAVGREVRHGPPNRNLKQQPKDGHLGGRTLPALHGQASERVSV